MAATLLFMAAGFGSRFGGGVKQMEPVGPNGEVLMEYAAHDALKAGFDRIVFIIRRDLEADFRAGVGRRMEKKCDVAYAFQRLDDLPAGARLPEGRTKPWGTSQAVLACRDIVRGPFCALNADDYYGPTALKLIHDALGAPEADAQGMRLCMAGYVLGNTLSDSGAVTRGICRVDENDRLLGLEETRGITVRDGAPCVTRDGQTLELDPATPVSMNIWGLPAAFMDYLGEGFERFMSGLGDNALSAEYLLPDAVAQMMRAGRGSVDMLRTNDRWFGMTYAADKAQAKAHIAELIARGTYPETL